MIDQGVHIATETGQEVAQEMVTIAGVNAGKAKSGLETDSLSDIGQRLKDTAVSSALTFGVLNVAGLSGRLANTAITRESLGKLSDSQKYATDEAVTKTYAEQLREEGYSEQGIEHFVKESEANRTSPNAAVEHAVQLVNEMNQEAHSIVEENAKTNVQTPIELTDIVGKLKTEAIPKLNTLDTLSDTEVDLLYKTTINQYAETLKSDGFTETQIESYLDEAMKTTGVENQKSAIVKLQREMGNGLETESHYMGSETNQIPWPDSNFGKLDVPKRKEISKYAREQYNLEISGLRQFDGDSDLLIETIDALGSMKETFPVIFEGKYKVRMQIYYPSNTSDFAVTNGHEISVNGMIFRDKAFLIDQLKDSDFVSDKPESVIYHEFGHVVQASYEINDIDLAKQAYYNMGKGELSTADILRLLRKDLSLYSIETLKKSNRLGFVTNEQWFEITSEVFSEMMTSEHPREFAQEYFRLIMRLIQGESQ